MSFINIQISGRHASLPLDCFSLVGDVLTHSCVTFVPWNARVEHRRFGDTYLIQRDDRIWFPVGQLPRVRAALEEAGISTSVDDRRTVISRTLVCACDCDPRLSDAIRTHVCGVLQVSAGKLRLDAIACLCDLLRQNRIFISVATRAKSQEIASCLSRQLGEDVRYVSGGDWQSPTRVVVGTYRSLDTSDPADWDVLVYEDVMQASCDATIDARNAYDNHRIYGFIDPAKNRTKNQELAHEALVGPIIYHNEESSGSRFRVQLIDYEHRVQELPSSRRERSKDVWGDDKRNHAIACTAQGIMDRTIDVGSAWGVWPIILVETPQHARALGDLLPGWQVLTGQHNDANLRCPSGVPEQSIMTMVRAASEPMIVANTIIYAAGGSYPKLPEGIAVRGDITVVDFIDHWNSRLLKDTHHRVQWYARAHWPVQGRALLPPLPQPDARPRRHQQDRTTESTSRR